MATITAYMTLIGEVFDPKLVTETIGIVPEIIRLPDEKLGNGRCFGHTEWSIIFVKEKCKDISELLKTIRIQFIDKADVLLEVATACNAVWHLLFYFESTGDDMPAVYFSKNEVSFAASIGAEIGFDFDEHRAGNTGDGSLC